MINATAVSVVWNEAPRIRLLAQTLAAHFAAVVIVVQKSDDETLEIAREALLPMSYDFPDRIKVIEDECRGGGDFSMPLALSHVRTEWSFVVSGDELPDRALLDSMNDAIEAMEQNRIDGAFIEFEETVDDQPFVQHGRHVRLFRTSGGWQARHHSAAPHDNVFEWKVGSIIHTRSLEEMCRDYLRKITMMEAEGEDQLVLHNRYTLFTVCNLVAGAKGWRYVWSLEQWPEIERRVFAYADTGMELL